MIQNGQYLLLHRVKKKNDANQDKWIGIGGKFEDKESPEDCMLREFQEETGCRLTDYRYRGIITFVSDSAETEYMHLFTASRYEGTSPNVTRVYWNGSLPRSFLLSVSGRETISFWICCSRISPSSP